MQLDGFDITVAAIMIFGIAISSYYFGKAAAMLEAYHKLDELDNE